MLRAGSVGHAVLDGFGVANDSFFTSRLDHLAPSDRFNALVRLLRASCRRYHPTRIVFGLPGHVRHQHLSLSRGLSGRLRRLGIPLGVRRMRDATSLLVEHLRRAKADEIIGQLATHFVPEVSPLVSRAHAHAWYWRPAWYAIAVALAELVEHHPRVAAALARPDAFRLRPFREAVTAAERRLCPTFVCSSLAP